MSTRISRFEKNISLQLVPVDAVGMVVLQRITELLKARPDLPRAEFGRRIARGHSWISEFFAGQRTTNDLRLLIKIARVFGVNVGYLLGESEQALDSGAATLVATWHELDERDRVLFLQVAAGFRKRAPETSEVPNAGSHAAPNEGRGRTRSKDDEPQRRKR